MDRKQPGAFSAELDDLLHPSRVFDRPSDVLNDPDLSLNEKRAVLASWASDACAVEAAPALRKAPSGKVVQFDEIMDALRSLDAEAQKARTARGRPTALRRAKTSRRPRGGGREDQGSPLH